MILDIVPNHMAASDENPFWSDPALRERFFDIDPATGRQEESITAVLRMDELKVEADVADRHVTIVEVRLPWGGVGEHTRFPIARLRYTRTTGQWSIYWRDHNLRCRE